MTMAARARAETLQGWLGSRLRTGLASWAHGSAKAGQDIDARFNEVLTCNSHSIWLAETVR